ncbi:hypothetical protein [Azospirillum thermophilum]|uniref:Uncharacterized protein n=1 Tax=Azospirillum thermophilum TaxID=2202148 RepID=A0A2S2CRW4_9PROT|nr:hypothetical protein [Azospirillum thermophilum]AWK87263.1 hypothetical protein DEW08_14465 [Azospirillum thermophilum]
MPSPQSPPFDPGNVGRITADEQVDALRTLIAVFATSVVRPGRPRPRNAVTAEIIDILDQVPADQAEAVAQLFTMMTLRLRRRARPRHTAFRLALETALLARGYTGAPPPPNEGAYVLADRPGLAAIDPACSDLLGRMAAVPQAEHRAWLTAQVIACGLIDAEQRHTLGGADRDLGDLAVAEFLVRAAAQYLASTAGPAPQGGPPPRKG